MKSTESWTMCWWYLVVCVSLVNKSMSRTLLKTLPTTVEHKQNHYNPEENLDATLFLAEGDILIDRDLYYSMIDEGDHVTGKERSGLEHETTRTRNDPEQMLPLEQGLWSHGVRSNRRQKRSIDSVYHLMWMNRTVPYEFDDNFGPSERSMVEKAMAVLEHLSCVHFKKRWDETDYVHIMVPKEHGCYSNVGRTGGRQDIGLSSECHFGTIIHELLHALGFWHEHNRKDRDKYITVLWDNISEGKQDNFRIPKGQTSQDVVLQKPYDYGSVMHYGNNTFSRNGLLPTLKAKAPLPPGVEMGQRLGPSQLDIEKLKALYMCEIRNCPNPGHLSNGNIHGPKIFPIGSKVIYSCLPGYILIGASERLCLTIGQWSGDKPSCITNSSRDPLHYCNFDHPRKSICGWTQSSDDGLNWTLNSGGTPTKGTGPYWDNTLNTAFGVYLYVEANPPGHDITKNVARLTSPRFEGNRLNNLCLVFFSYMYGQYMGSLSVYKRTEVVTNYISNTSNTTTTDNNTTIAIDTNTTTTISYRDELLFTIKGDQGNEWRQIYLVLGKITQPFHIVLEGSIGGWASDIAIDDLVVGSCQYFKPIALSGGLHQDLECSFDDGHTCLFLQDRHDSTNWIVRRGRTPTINTGPDCDPINCSTGRYLYLEASGPRRPGDTATLKTPVIGGQGPTCLSFFYHMYGVHIGSLNIRMTSAISGNDRTLWVRSGDQGDRWFHQNLEFIALEAYTITIEGVVGSSYRGDIAIDSVHVTSGGCTGLMNFNCNFEHDVCGWMNVSRPGDTKDWTRHVGETSTPLTGPQADRTNPDGYYLYVESSRSFDHDSARLISPTIRQVQTGYCLGFWYHMYGEMTGNLTVYVQSDIGQEEIVWTKIGEQGNHWIFQNLHLMSFPAQNIRVIFEVRLNGYKGDTAIDDVSIHTGSCDNSNQ